MRHKNKRLQKITHKLAKQEAQPISGGVLLPLERRKPEKRKPSRTRRTDINQTLVNDLARRGAEAGRKREDYWDKEVHRFGVQLSATGNISFVLDYRFPDAAGVARQRRIVIGQHPDFTAQQARDEASELRKQVRKGIDPKQKKKRREERYLAEAAARKKQALLDSRTIEDVAAHYLDTHARTKKRPKSRYEDERMWNNIILPSWEISDENGRRISRHEGWKGRRASEIREEDVRDLHNALSQTPYQANRVLSLLHKAFDMALAAEWVSKNPVSKRITRYGEPKREYWLQEAEMVKLQRALDESGDQQQADAFRLLLLTGARSKEVIEADWSEFDFKRAWWTRLDERNKEKKRVDVPLSEAAMSLVRRMHEENSYPASGPLFPGRKDGESRTTLRNLWKRVQKAAGLPLTCRIHDLRHSFASHAVSNGVPLAVVGRLLGHSQPQTTARYAKFGDDALRKAANQVGEHYESLSDQKPRLVSKK